MQSSPIRMLVILGIMLLTVACGEDETLWQPAEVTLQVELPEPLSDEETGVLVSPDSVVQMSGDISIDTESIPGNPDDVTGIVIVIVPTVVSFDSTGGRAPESGPLSLQSAELDSAVTVSIYFAPEGTGDPFRESFHAADFSIDIEGNDVTGLTGAVDLPPSVVDIILTGRMVIGARVESLVSGRLVIRVADLTFHLEG